VHLKLRTKQWEDTSCAHSKRRSQSETCGTKTPFHTGIYSADTRHPQPTLNFLERDRLVARKESPQKDSVCPG